MTSLIHHLIVEVKMSYPLTSSASNSSITDFKMAQLFQILLKAAKVSVATEVQWCPPAVGSVKANIDGSAFGLPFCASIGVVFRKSRVQFLGGLVHNIGHNDASTAQLSAAMFAVEKYVDMNWRELWIEACSMLVVRVFAPDIVPWGLRTRWINYLHLANSLVFREGNQVVNALAHNGQGLAPFA